MRARANRRYRSTFLTPEDYGCNANGDSNATPFTAAMQAAAEEGKILDLSGRTYICREQMQAPADQRLWMRNGTLQINPDTPVRTSGGTNLLTQANTTWPAVSTLSISALRGTSAITLNSVGDLQVGDYIVVWSNKEMTGYAGSYVYSRRCDFVRIRSIDGTTLTLFSRLRADFNTTDGAAVIKVLQTGGVFFENMTFIGSGLLKNERGFSSTYAFQNVYRNCAYKEMDRSALGELMCAFTHSRGHRYKSTLAPELGYGMSIGSCFAGDYGDLNTLRARHAFTLASPSAAANRLSGTPCRVGNILSQDATGSFMDQHPGAPFITVGNVSGYMHNDADRSSPIVTVQGAGMTLGHVRGENASAGGIGFQCLGWYEHADYVPTVRFLSIDGNSVNGGMLTLQNRTTNLGEGVATGQKIAMYGGQVGGTWLRGMRIQAYDGDAKLSVQGGFYTCFTQGLYLNSSAFGKPIAYLDGTEFEQTSTTTTPIILQGKAYALAHPGEYGGEINWLRGNFDSPLKEIANSYGLIRTDDLDDPPDTAIYQEGGQAVSPVHRWTTDGLLGVFAANENGMDLAETTARYSIAGYPVLGFPQLGFKAPTGNAEPDGSSIDTEALTLPAGTAAADGSALDIASITASDANLRAVLAFVKAVAGEQQKHGRHLKAHADAGLAHGYIRFTDVLPPVNLTAPVVTGIPADGSLLTTTDGTWTNTPTGYTYQWFRGASPIGGATSSTYTQDASDVGEEITVQVTASNTGDDGAPATSNIIYTGRPYNTVAPALSYVDLYVGSTITCSDGTWGNSPTGYTYQWFRGLVEITGETTNEYTIGADDDGSILTCQVTASNANGDVTESSDSVGPIEVGWTMRDMPGIVEWGYADTLTDGAVASWPGVIAAITPAQATGANQPTKSSTSFNGHPGVAGGSSKWLELVPAPGGFATGSADGWMFAVIKVGSLTGGNVMAYGFSSSTTGRYFQQQALLPDGNYTLRASSPLSPSAALTTPTLPEYAIMFGQWNADGTVAFWCNGTLAETSAAGTIATLATRFRLFAGAGTSAGTTWDGEIAHWAVGTGVPDVADIQRAMGLGAWWCDLQDYLPEDHPYRHTPPWET